MIRQRVLAVVLSAAFCTTTVLSTATAQAVSSGTSGAGTSTAGTTSTSGFDGATGSDGTPVPVTVENEMPAGGVFSTGTAWKLDVSAAPVNPASAGMVRTVVDQTAKYYGGVAAFNAYQYSTSFYTVPANQPTVDVAWSNCQGKPYTPAGLLGPGGQFTQVPIPADAVPAKGSDSQLTVYSPATDQLWEFWVASKANGTWTACWGGRIDQVSKSHGYFPGSFGASASGLALAGGTIGIRDVESGSIDHALALHLLSPGQADEISYPAQRSDGTDTSVGRVPEGTRLRLDPSFDVDGSSLTPIGKMVAKAAQKYGFVVTDRAGCTAVVAESPAASIAATGVDPWKKLMGGTPDYALMKDFPWSSLQALPKDYGKPAVLDDTSGGGVWSDYDPATLDVRYVSDTAFRTVRNGWGPVEKDRSNAEIAAGDGKPLRIAGITFAKGLGTHAPSEVVVPTGGAATFTAKVGLDDETGQHGSAVFQVWNGTTKLADSGTMRGGLPARTITADISGATEIRLVVTDAGDGNSGDHADWVDARLLTPKGGTPTPTPSPSTSTPAPTTTTTYASDGTYRVVRNGWGPAEPDRSNGELSGTDGRTLTVAGQTFTKGFGVHADSEIVVPTGGAATFSAEVGVDDEVLPRGSVVFSVFNGDVKLAETGVIRAGQTARKLTVDVSGATEIRLVASDGGDGNSGDHGDWGDAKFLTPVTAGSTPAPTTTAPTSTPTTAPTSTPTTAPTSTPTTAPSSTPTTAPSSSTPAPTTTSTPVPTTTTSTPTPTSSTPSATPTSTPTPTRTPVAVSSTAYRTVRNGYGPVERDRSNGEIKAGDGRTLKIGTRSYSTGLGVHAASEVVVPVGGASTFTTDVGVDAEVGQQGSVVFQVWNGGTKLADSGVLRGGGGARTLTVDVSGATEIRLVVTDAGDGNASDHADWASATLS